MNHDSASYDRTYKSRQAEHRWGSDLAFWETHFTTRFISQWCQQGDWIDLGCGTGEIDWHIVKNNSAVSILGVDFSTVALQHARLLPPLEGLDWLFADITAPLELSTAAFNGCICSHTLEHIEDPAPLLHEIARVVEPGGLLIAIVPHLHRHDAGSHCWHFSPDGLSGLLAKHGVVKHLEITPDVDQIGAIVRLPE